MILEWSDAVDRLQSPFASEDLALAELPMLVVRLVPGATVSAALAGALASVRAVTVAVADGDFSVETAPVESHPVETVTRGSGGVAAHFDVVLDAGALGSETVDGPVGGDVLAHLQTLHESVRANPMAAVALVQLLRLSAFGESGSDVSPGLLAESLTYSMLQSGPEFARWATAHKPGPASTGSLDAGPVVLVHPNTDGSHSNIELNRPHRANAFNAAMRDGLVEALRALAVDPDVLTIEVSGAGPNFCSGGDLGEFATLPDPATAHATRLTRSPAAWMHRVASRTTVMLHGACAGAGIELPAFSHRVIAAPDTDIWLPEISLGLVPGAGGTVSIPRRIGRHRTAWLALTGTHLDAETALAWGLVDEII